MHVFPNAVKVYNVYDVTVKQLDIKLNFEQNIKTLSKILSIIGKKKNFQKKIGENKSKIDLSLTTTTNTTTTATTTMTVIAATTIATNMTTMIMTTINTTTLTKHIQ